MRPETLCLAVAACSFTLAACDKIPGFEPDADSSAEPAGSETAPKDEAAAKADGAPAEKSAAKGGSAKIDIKVKDVELFHPYSPERAMASLRDDGTFDTSRSRLRYGVGIVIEATNGTGEVLRDATFEGIVTFSGDAGESRCHFSADAVAYESGARYVAYAAKPPTDVGSPWGGPAPKAGWVDESGSTTEAVWRPSERIRLSARRNECEGPVLADLGAKSVTAQLTVKARREFVDSAIFELSASSFEMALDGDHVRIRDRASSRLSVVALKDVGEMVAGSGAAPGGGVPLERLTLTRLVRAWERDQVESAPVEIALDPASLTLQLVKLPSGEMAAASGDFVIHLKEGKVAYDSLAKLGVSLHSVERADVPGARPEVSFVADELSGSVTDATLSAFTDDTALAKGQKKLAVAWKLAIKGDEIDKRLRTAVDAAQAALMDAERASLAADVSGDAAAQAKSKADLAAAKAASTGAETRYKSGLSSERSRLAKLVACGDIKLATNKGVRAAVNAKDGTDACKALEASNDASFTLSFALDRYELPVALVYAVGKTMTWSAVASAPMSKLDPR